MSMKKFFIALLAMILCFSMLMTACDNAAKNEDDEEEEKKESEASASDEKQLIIDKIAAFNIKTIIDTAISNLDSGALDNVGNMVGDVFETIDATNAEANIDVTLDGEKINIYAGIKDGILQATAVDSEGYAESVYLILKESGILSIDSYFQVDGTSDLGIDPAEYLLDVDMSEFKAELDAILTDEIMNVLGEFKFPELKADDLTKDGDFYYIKEAYYSKVAEKVLDLVVDVMKAAGAADSLPSQAELDSALTMINSVIDALNLKIGFAAGNDAICGFAISVDANLNEIAEYFGSGYSDSTDTIKASFKVLCTKDLKAPKYIRMTADVNVDGVSAVINASIDPILVSNELKGTELKLEADIKNVTISEYGESSMTSDGTYSSIYTNIYGEISIDFTGKIDLSDVDTANTKLVEFDLDVVVTATKAESYDGYDNEVEEDVDLANYGGTVTSSGNITIKSKGSAGINFEFKQTDADYENKVLVNGTFNWLSAPNYKALPSGIDESLISKYNAALENAEEIRGTVYNPAISLDDWVSYLYYDASTGLYILLEGEYENQTSIYMIEPEEYLYDSKIN